MCEFLVWSSVTILYHCKCRLIVSLCGYTGFFLLTVRHVASGCDMLSLGTVCSTSGIQVVLGCGKIFIRSRGVEFFMVCRYHHAPWSK